LILLLSFALEPVEPLVFAVAARARQERRQSAAECSNYAEVVVRRQEADMTIWPT
jgi:hypothetical protein